jgi:EmrB/QacA subfamily drug resistance transporter
VTSVWPRRTAASTQGRDGTARPRPDRSTLLAFGGVLVVLFLVSTNLTVVGTALPRIIAELDGFHLYAWAFTAFNMTSMLAVPVFGRLSDAYGRKRLMLAGIVLFSAASAAAGLSQTMTHLVALRALQGLGGGALVAITWATLGDLFTARERGAYQGVTSGVFGISSIVGPILGGIITDSLGWRWVFFVNVPVALVAFLIVVRYVPLGQREPGARIDGWGILLLTAGTVPLLVALSVGGVTLPWASPPLIALVGVAVAFGWAFIAWERRAPDPLLPLHLFRDASVAVAGVGTFLCGGALFAAIVYLPLYVQGVVGASAAASGFALAPLMGGFVVSGIVAGRAVSRSGAYRPWVIGGTAVVVAAMAAAAGLGPTTPVTVIVAVSFAIGLGLGPPLSMYVLAAQNATSPALLGTVTGAIQFARQLGGTLAVAIFGSVIAVQLARGLRAAGATLAGASVETAALLGSANTLTDPQRLALATERVTRELGPGAVDGVLATLRGSLGAGVSGVFSLAGVGALLALAVALRLPRVRLVDSARVTERGAATHGPLVQGDEDASVEGTPHHTRPAPLERERGEVARQRPR